MVLSAATEKDADFCWPFLGAKMINCTAQKTDVFPRGLAWSPWNGPVNELFGVRWDASAIHDQIIQVFIGFLKSLLFIDDA